MLDTSSRGSIRKELRASDGCLLAKARTVWCPIDAVTCKPTSVSAEVRAAFPVS
jgi:acyl-CoA thioesterase FadM